MRLRTALGILIPLLAGHVGAQTPQCDISDRECLEALISSECMSSEGDARSCSAFRELLNGSSLTDQPTIKAHVGAFYLMQAARAPNLDERNAFQDQAEQVLLEVLEIDPSNEEALNALSALEAGRGSFQRASEYYRIVYESRPNSPTVHRAYVAFLSQSGEEGMQEALLLTRQRYDQLSQDGDLYRWRYASDLYSAYRSRGMTAEALAFRNEVSETIGLAGLEDAFSTPQNLDVPNVENGLALICNHVVSIIGHEPCVQGITTAIAAIHDIPDAQTRSDMAGAAITGISEIGKEASMGNLDRDWQDWVQQFNTWVTSLEQAAGESARLYEIRAVMTTDSTLKRSYMESSVRLEPDEWHYRLRLGQLYMDLEEYALAAEQFEEALGMVTDEAEAERVSGWLERARDTL